MPSTDIDGRPIVILSEQEARIVVKMGTALEVEDAILADEKALCDKIKRALGITE